MGIWKSLLTVSYTEENNTYPVLQNHITSVPGIFHAVAITGLQERQRKSRRNSSHHRIDGIIEE